MTTATLPLDHPVMKWASLSEDGKYRYSLGRRWDQTPDDEPPPPTMFWLMLNPSTADGTLDDQTIRKCIAIAKREGCGGIEVLNLYAYRATTPAELFKVEDPTGPQNLSVVSRLLSVAYDKNFPVVVAWGAQARAMERRFGEGIRSLVAQGNRRFKCLGVTADGEPRHPCRLALDTPLIDWP